MNFSLLAYTAALHGLLPWALARLAWRARRQPEYLRHVGERLGRYPAAPPRPVIWVHAVSVGETRAAEPLIRALLAAHPGLDLLLTHATPTGREAGARIFGRQVLQAYLPYDLPWAVERFLDHFRPRLGILMETEIWFNLIRAAAARGIPMVLANARLSERSARRYGRFPALAADALGRLAGVAAQTEADAERLAALGAGRVTVTGNLKFDVAPPDNALQLATALRRRFGEDRPVLLAASTRQGEETLLLDALPRLAPPGALLILVPRHPQRFEAVAELLRQRNIPFQRRSEEQPIASDTRVVLGDSMGEMFAYYGACDAAFVGGSLLPLGGQNFIEACAMGKPVILGPHTYNFREAAELAVAAGAALRIKDAAGVMEQATRLFGDPRRLAAMGNAGREFAVRHRGATQRTLATIRF